jgi:uncharacterized protein (DUF1810 family)
MNTPADPHDLQRFRQAQDPVYLDVLDELKAGLKRSHWMWFVFPQVDGLGLSPTSRHYAIKSHDEAHAYLADPVLGARLRECVQVLLALQNRSAAEIFGFPDDRKLCSSMTLFALVSPAGSEFEQVLGRYFEGQQDDRTVTLFQQLPARGPGD